MQSAAQQCAKRNKEKEKDNKKSFKLTAKTNHRIAEDTGH